MGGSPAQGSRQRRAHLGRLRGVEAVAVAAVLVHHFFPLAVLDGAFTVPWGFLGVRLFFVLSGFLITGILLRARNDAMAATISQFDVLRSFYIRRFLRIFPLYYFVIAVCLVLNVPPVRDALPSDLGMLMCRPFGVARLTGRTGTGGFNGCNALFKRLCSFC